MIESDWENWTEVRVDNSKVWPVTEGNLRIGFTILDEIWAWIEEKAGERQTIRQVGTWRYSLPITDTFTLFYFQDPDLALIFKLTWG